MAEGPAHKVPTLPAESLHEPQAKVGHAPHGPSRSVAESPAVVVRFFSAMDDTHLMWGREFPGARAITCGNVPMRSGGFSWAAGGDNHKLQGGAQSPHNTRRATGRDARQVPLDRFRGPNRVPCVGAVARHSAAAGPVSLDLPGSGLCTHVAVQHASGPLLPHREFPMTASIPVGQVVQPFGRAPAPRQG
jgi:hypothetical protein